MVLLKHCESVRLLWSVGIQFEVLCRKIGKEKVVLGIS